MTPAVDMTGRRCGHLTVIARTASGADGKARWICQCDCGNRHEAIGANLRRGIVRSCGCQRVVLAKKAPPKPIPTYLPLECVLEKTSVRLLRALRRFDEVTSGDLLDALDVEEELQRLAYSSRLRAMSKIGLVRRVPSYYDRYSITQAGRDWLARQLARADVGVASDEEAAA